MTFIEKLQELVKSYRDSKEACFSLTDLQISQIFNAGVKHGLFEDDNFGMHDKKNSVYLLISTLFSIDTSQKEIQLSGMTVEEIAQKTEDAYSIGRYRSWTSCIKSLQKAKYNDYQIQAILLSKIMRWAADRSKNPNRPSSSNDLMRYLERTSMAQIEEITKETFPEYTGIQS